jgi:hypothetical protein
MSKLGEHLAADQQVFLKLSLSQTKHRMRILKLQPAVTHSKVHNKLFLMEQDLPLSFYDFVKTIFLVMSSSIFQFSYYAYLQ